MASISTFSISNFWEILVIYICGCLHIPFSVLKPVSKRCSMADLKNMSCKQHQNGYKYLLSFLRCRWVAAVSDLQSDPDPFHLQRPVQLKRVPLGLSGWACRVYTSGRCCSCRPATFRGLKKRKNLWKALSSQWSICKCCTRNHICCWGSQLRQSLLNRSYGLFYYHSERKKKNI